MGRLAEYFCVIGVKDKSNLYDGKVLEGCVIQKFPENEWKSSPCPPSLELFCQPSGWYCSKEQSPPTFYVAILTDVEGKGSYLACLNFHEAIQQEVIPIQNNANGAQDDGIDGYVEQEKSFETFHVPMCLCIVSREKHYNTLKDCLTTIFHAHLNDQKELVEKIIGTMLGLIYVPPPGGSFLKFSLGGGDEQVVQPPLSADLPCTNDSVAVLFNLLGIYTILQVFTALVTESKILLLSSSFTHLSMACEALVSLLYPMKFNYVFIPILPASLLDFLLAPTPYLMGVHTEYQHKMPDLFDVVVVNIDEGCVQVPECIRLVPMPDPYYSCVLKSLKMILTPSLFSSDMLIRPDEKPPAPISQDKELRAVFIKLFADMFCGYRACLTLIRVYPNPVITFNKMSFIEKRGFVNDDFFNKVFDSVAFSTMMQARGPPYRVIDMFDNLISEVDPPQREKDIRELLADLVPIVDCLCQNEPWYDNPEQSLVPHIGAEMLRKPLNNFSELNQKKIDSMIRVNDPHDVSKIGSYQQPPTLSPCQVPISTHDKPTPNYINQRRLEVLQDCIQYIYDDKISDARKALPSVLRALKGKGAQLALCNELESRVKSESGMLNHDQYSLIVRLINAALQDDQTMNSIFVAARLVPLAAAFHRKLGPGVVQFAYTDIQQHAIWSNMQFWEEAFYTELQRQIVELHVKEKQEKQRAEKGHAEGDEASATRTTTTTTTTDSTSDNELTRNHVHSNSVNNVGSNNLSNSTNHKRSNELVNHVVQNHDTLLPSTGIGTQSLGSGVSGGGGSGTNSNRNSCLIAPTTPTTRMRVSNAKSLSPVDGEVDDENATKEMPDAMKLAADLLSEWDRKSEGEKERLIYAEETIIYSLTMLFVQRMMYLRVPTSACTEMRRMQMMRQKENEKRKHELSGDSPLGSGVGAHDDNISIAATKRSNAMTDAASTYYGGSIIDGSSGFGSHHDLSALNFGESVKDATSKFINRFVERVGIEANMADHHLKNLQQNIPTLVGMHIEALEEVYRETKDQPKMKVKIMKPTLLEEETLQFDGLRCYLVSDGRELGVRTEDTTVANPNEATDDDREINMGTDIGGPCLLPAEGALFLTNYRVIFKGTPVDQFASEMTVTRAFPIGALLREKKITTPITVRSGSDGIEASVILQLRSSTMQLIRVAFDEDEVSLESIENFRKCFQRSRWPPSVYNTFAFNYKTAPVLQRTLSQRQHSIRKTHRSLSSVVQLKKIAAGRDSAKGVTKTAMAEDKTTRQYQAVNRTHEEDDTMQQVILERENRGADRLSQSALCRDYERLELGAVSKIVAVSQWRLSLVNYHYNGCRGYPAVIVTPSRISDDVIMKVSKNYRLQRFPVAVWKHKRTKGTLLRSGSINKAVLSAALKSDSGMTAHTLNATEDAIFFSEIVSATQLYKVKGKLQKVSTGAAVSVQAMANDHATYLEGSETIQQVIDEKAEINNWKPAHLYVFTDRAMAKGARLESSSRIVVVNVDLHDVQQVKNSFLKLTKVACPSKLALEKNFLSGLEESKWMEQLSSLLQVASSIVNLIDIQGSSCLVSFGDGAEVTAQVVSLVQILSDPYYRTIEGFKVLIEKDWLAFGYRFSHRGNHVTPQQQSIAPFFLQFLDCVFQVICQYPHAFEYNNYFLKFIAYHQTSMRFNTFFLDSEHERYQHGWFPDSELPRDPSKSLKNMNNGGAKGANLKAEILIQQQMEHQKKKLTSVSLWDHFDAQEKKFTLFNSFTYHPNLSKTILQPFSNISNLEIWDYYTAENLYTGPTYDLELLSDFEMASPGTEGPASAMQAPDVEREDSQRCFTGCYGNTLEFPRDEATYLLFELIRLKAELDHDGTEKWRILWDDLDIKDLLKRKSRQMNWQDCWGRERRIALQKRNTLNLVLRGKVTDTGQPRGDFGFELPHDFIPHNYIVPSICNYCLQSIAGLRAGLRCSQCNYNTHDKCQSMVPAQCPKHPSHHNENDQEISGGTHTIFDMERSNARNHKGTLYKQGKMLRQWKARWFVLDAERNRLTYYNSEEDTSLQGHIDLGEVRATLLKNPPQGAPKESRTYFELETTKRTYQLSAAQPKDAKEWVERFNALNV